MARSGLCSWPPAALLLGAVWTASALAQPAPEPEPGLHGPLGSELEPEFEPKVPDAPKDELESSELGPDEPGADLDADEEERALDTSESDESSGEPADADRVDEQPGAAAARRRDAALSDDGAPAPSEGARTELTQGFEMQSPAPQPDPQELTSTRHLQIAATGAVVLRGESNDSLDYGPGYSVGGFVRPRLAPWMAVTASFGQRWVPVDLEPGAYDFAGDEHPPGLRQPTLEGFSLALSAEPIWQAAARLDVYGIFGIGWSRLLVPAPRFDGFEPKADRTAAEVDLIVGLGVAWEVVPDHLAVHLRLQHGFILDRFGTATESLQAVHRGDVVYFAPLPETGSVSSLSLAVGWIL